MSDEQDKERWNLKDAVLPIGTIGGIIIGALVIQSRLLSVEYAVQSLEKAVTHLDTAGRERLAMFASALKQLNPSLNVPEVSR